MADPRGLPISTIVDIATSVAAGGVLRREFGLGLIVTTGDALPAGGPEKMTRYDSIQAIQDAGHTGEALASAQVWYAADPAPKALYIGRWATAEVTTTMVGKVPGTVTALAVANSSFRINGHNFTGVNLSTLGTYAAIASALQTAIRAGGAPFTAATVTYSATANGGSGGFLFDLKVPAAIAGGKWEKATTNVGTDQSAALGFAEPTSYKPGHVAETLVEALAEMVPLATRAAAPVLVMVDGSCPAELSGVKTREALASWIQADDYFAFVRDNGETALVTNEGASLSAKMFAQQFSHIEAIIGAGENFGVGTTYPDVAANALLSSQRLTLPASIISVHPKPLPGAVPILITAGQLAEAKRKRASVYTTVAGLPSLLGGYTGKAGTWSDAQYWLLWLKNEMETAIFNAQRASRRFNTAILENIVHQTMAIALRNGGIQRGGKVNAGTKQDIIDTTGNNDFDGFLTTGYLLWVERPSVRTDLDRENRIGRFKVWAAPADAIHEVLGDIVLSG